MFFEDHEKSIYTPESKPDLKFDPLAVERILVLASKGKLDALLKQWSPVDPTEGDISTEGRVQAELSRADAESLLVDIARKAFGFKPFPDTTDAEVLEVFCDYLWWMEKKGERGETPQTSQPHSA